MNEHLGLETCKRLKAAGYPQNHTGMAWLNDPGQGWCRAYGTGKEGRPFLVASKAGGSYFFGEWIAQPEIITADGKGGVLGWLALEKNVYCEATVYSCGPRWSCDLLSTDISFDSPEAMVAAVLDKMEEKP